MTRVVCSCCKGTGRVRVPIDWYFAVFTVGLSLLVGLSDREKCKVCDGKGYLEQ